LLVPCGVDSSQRRTSKETSEVVGGEGAAPLPSSVPPKKEKLSAYEVQYRELEKVAGRVERLDRYGLFTEVSSEWKPRAGYEGPRSFRDIREKIKVRLLPLFWVFLGVGRHVLMIRRSGTHG